jgi:hypothetical protein
LAKGNGNLFAYPRPIHFAAGNGNLNVEMRTIFPFCRGNGNLNGEMGRATFGQILQDGSNRHRFFLQMRDRSFSSIPYMGRSFICIYS